MHPTLKAETAYVFDYVNLEKLVKEIYDIDIEILDLIFEPNNGSYMSFTVDGNKELFTVGDDVLVAKWIETGQMRNLDLGENPDPETNPWWPNDPQCNNVGLEHIMHRLFIDGHIPAGEYVMTVDW